ncbi:TPA: hypothetical protein ACS78B_002499, partial [Providencia alcalifaciens]
SIKLIRRLIVNDNYYTIHEYAKKLKISSSTIRRNPKKFNMFKVGGSWRANERSLKLFEQSLLSQNNIIRLASGGQKETTECLFTKGESSTGLIYQHQTARELDALLR